MYLFSHDFRYQSSTDFDPFLYLAKTRCIVVAALFQKFIGSFLNCGRRYHVERIANYRFFICRHASGQGYALFCAHIEDFGQIPAIYAALEHILVTSFLHPPSAGAMLAFSLFKKTDGFASPLSFRIAERRIAEIVVCKGVGVRRKQDLHSASMTGPCGVMQGRAAVLVRCFNIRTGFKYCTQGLDLPVFSGEVRCGSTFGHSRHDVRSRGTKGTHDFGVAFPRRMMQKYPAVGVIGDDVGFRVKQQVYRIGMTVTDGTVQSDHVIDVLYLNIRSGIKQRLYYFRVAARGSGMQGSPVFLVCRGDIRASRKQVQNLRGITGHSRIYEPGTFIHPFEHCCHP